MRFLLAGLVLAGIVLLTRRAFPRGRSLTGAALYGTVGFAGFLGFMGLALREVPVGTVSVFFALTPLITFGLAILQRQERFHLQGIAGGLIALAGVAVIFADQLTANVPLSGLLLAVAGIVCLAESAVIVHWIPRSDPFATNAAAMLTGGSLLLIASLLMSERHAVPVHAATLAGLVYLVLLGSVVLFTLFVFTLERWPASTVSYASLVSPMSPSASSRSSVESDLAGVSARRSRDPRRRIRRRVPPRQAQPDLGHELARVLPDRRMCGARDKPSGRH